MTTDVLSDTDVSLKVVSNASGRMRVCVTGFNVDAVRAVAIEETVSQVTGVHAVHAYPRTASVVIWYSPELGDTAAVLSAITKAQHVPAELVPARAPHSAGVRGVGVVRKITGGIRRMLSRPPGVDKPLKASRCGGRPRGPVRGSASWPGEQNRRERRTWLPRVWLALPLGLLALGSSMFFGAYPWAGGWPSPRRCRCNSWPGGRFCGGGATGAGVDLEHGHADRAGYADRVCLLHVSVVCRWTSVLRHLGADHRVRGVGPPSRGQSNRKSVRGDQQAAGAGRQGSHAACRRPRAPGAGRSGPSRRPGAGAARREDPGRR